jgi:hypothetical protein
VRDDLDVALAAEHVAPRRELGAELSIVVDLAVHDRDDVAALVLDRLVSRLQVDDREPPHRERAALERTASLAVRPAVTQELDRVERRRRAGPRVHAEDPTHAVIVAEAAGRTLYRPAT